MEMWWLIARRCGSGLLEMWWLIGRAPDFWDKGPGYESGNSHNDPRALQDHCVIL